LAWTLLQDAGEHQLLPILDLAGDVVGLSGRGKLWQGVLDAEQKKERAEEKDRGPAAAVA
jgi:hypothetical protein